MSDRSLEELRAEARYAQDRLSLYRARALTGKPTRQMRMQELEREAQAAQQRLDRALEQQGRPPSA